MKRKSSCIIEAKKGKAQSLCIVNVNQMKLPSVNMIGLFFMNEKVYLYLAHALPVFSFKVAIFGDESVKIR